MRTLLATSLVLALAAPGVALADDLPHCTIKAINHTDMDLLVAGVYRQGMRWAEYNCRTESKAMAQRWAEEHGECVGKSPVVRWTLLLGRRGLEKRMELTAFCKKH